MAAERDELRQSQLSLDRRDQGMGSVLSLFPLMNHARSRFSLRRLLCVGEATHAIRQLGPTVQYLAAARVTAATDVIAMTLTRTTSSISVTTAS